MLLTSKELRVPRWLPVGHTSLSLAPPTKTWALPPTQELPIRAGPFLQDPVWVALGSVARLLGSLGWRGEISPISQEGLSEAKCPSQIRDRVQSDPRAGSELTSPLRRLPGEVPPTSALTLTASPHMVPEHGAAGWGPSLTAIVPLPGPQPRPCCHLGVW